MLARVKRCQRPLLRYAFSSDAVGPTGRFVLFLNTGGEPHVLGAKNIYYDSIEGAVRAVPGMNIDYSVQADINNFVCPTPAPR